ncbi:hypothetical protein Tco_0919187 [Tanacetum coccineum]
MTKAKAVDSSPEATGMTSVILAMSRLKDFVNGFLNLKSIRSIDTKDITTSRYVVPTGRVKVPAGRYVVPTGKMQVLVVFVGGLDHVNPVIRLPLEHGISRVLWKDDHSNPELTLLPPLSPNILKKHRNSFREG